MKLFNKLIIFLLIIISVGVIFVYFVNKVDKEREIHEKVLAVEKENKRKEFIIENNRKLYLKEAEKLSDGYFYKEAIEKLKENPEIMNQEIEIKINEYSTAINNSVKYDGPIEHIFFHSLILYPEYLFKDLIKPDAGYNSGFTYKTEINRILPELLARGYVLYDITKLFTKNDLGVMEMKDIYLPPGKKPLILSIDDPSYHYGIGFAKKLILSDDGNLMSEVVTPEGKTIFTKDGDVELVIENFIEEHPEFSYQGARGTVAATGYMGIFGYDLKTESSQESAKKVVLKLKEKGWTFASHSYSHNRKNYFSSTSKVSNIESDTKKWKEKIEPIVGSTNIFIAPFGYLLKGKELEVILNNGFDIYCTVGLRSEISVNNRYALMSRNEIGGYALRMYKNEMNNRFFDPDKVIDSYRPPLR